MKVLAAIRNHGDPAYLAVQALLLSAGTAPAAGFFLKDHDIHSAWPALLSAGTAAAGMALLARLQRR